ncbi:MAG: hypothetical protein MI807_01760 [Verrucomicrobiales bacterium]|nr:hypothetical protein [Verrucomicrobiales bacterium]
METLESIERAVEELDEEELAAFREWFTSFDASKWDEKIEHDISAGKLDELAEAGIAEFEKNETRAL